MNAIYRLGDRQCARLPRVETWAGDLDKELRWLPKLAPQLSLRVPEPVAKGRPTSSYPFPWAIYGWIDGRSYADALVDDEPQAARELARFVGELRRVDPSGAPSGGRRPLRELDAVTRMAIESGRGIIDSDAAMTAWEHALQAPVWTGAPVWIHCDLLRPNLLVRDGRLCAVIDFGGAGIGDPAADVIASWSVFGPAEACSATPSRSTTAPGPGHAATLDQAALIVPYYRETNPEFAAPAKRTIEEILADVDA